MLNQQAILAKISERTLEIRNKYPELQKYLDETRITLPQGNNNPLEMDTRSLESYLDELTLLIKNYEENKS
tara:strand:- start:598 stop:810 length:213 start_codon:yes stop_codon:yes gene_type:complete